jgi:hypothetical protein
MSKKPHLNLTSLLENSCASALPTPGANRSMVGESRSESQAIIAARQRLPTETGEQHGPEVREAARRSGGA